MFRSKRIALFATAVVVFLVVSLILARLFATANTERTAVVDAIRAQSIAHPGTFKLLRYDGPSKFSIASRSAAARVVWRVGTTLPLVQCVTVARAGNLLTGFDVTVIKVGAPIGLESDC
ncbi:MAG: hypothetical protein WCK06_02540 [Actinomycetota bacterium]